MNRITLLKYPTIIHSGTFSRKKTGLSLLFAMTLFFVSGLLFPARIHAAGKGSVKLAITGSSWSIYRDGQYIIQLKKAGKGVKWSISNSSVASLKKKSATQVTLTPKKKGTVTVKAIYKKKTYKKKIKINGARLQIPEGAFFAGKSYKLTLKSANKTTKWAVSDTKIARIQKGTGAKAALTPVLAGIVHVKAKFKNVIYTRKIYIQPLLSTGSIVFKDQETQNLRLVGVSPESDYEVTNWQFLPASDSGAGKIYWAIENPLIVSIAENSTGQVAITPQSKGMTAVAVKYNGLISICQITVDDIFPSDPDPEKKEEVLPLPNLALPSDVPSYWKDELADAVARIERNRKTDGDMSSFFFLTDPHWYRINGEPISANHYENAGHSPAIINYLTDLLHPMFTMVGGDVVNGIYRYMDREAAVESAKNEINDFYSQFNPSTVNLLTTVGNHDTNSNDQQNEELKLSANELYTTMIQPSLGFAETEYDQLESYVDDEENKIRYISFFFDGIHGLHYDDINRKDFDWLDARINELEEGWTVILFSHAYWKGAVKEEANVPSDNAFFVANHLANLDATAKADIALWMVGHCHRDLHQKVASNDGTASFHIVSSNCDNFNEYKSYNWGGLSMTRGTATEQAIDFVQVSPQNHKIYLTRIGAGEDRELDIE